MSLILMGSVLLRSQIKQWLHCWLYVEIKEVKVSSLGSNLGSACLEFSCSYLGSLMVLGLTGCVDLGWP